jgi:hypothetical protein
MALNPSGAISLAGPSTGESIAIELGVSATATISLNDTNVRTLAGVASGVIIMPTDFWGKSNFTPTQKAIFGFGTGPTPLSVRYSVTNLVSSSGVVATDTPGVGTARSTLSAASYGGDKAIFAYGQTSATPGNVSVSNLVSNTGVVSSDTPGTGTARQNSAGVAYGGDKALFLWGSGVPNSNLLSIGSYVTNTGVIGSDTPIAGTRSNFSGASYGVDKAIVAFGSIFVSPTTVAVSTSNLISNTGVVASDTPGVGTARANATSAGYGGDKAIFAFGSSAISNLVSNTGVVATDTPIAASSRLFITGTNYGGDKAIFAFGRNPTPLPNPSTNTINLVSNTGVVAANTPGTGTARASLRAAGYSTVA